MNRITTHKKVIEVKSMAHVYSPRYLGEDLS
jgi:hypothetical protein